MFYDVVLGVFGIKNFGFFGNGWVFFGCEKLVFIIVCLGNGEVFFSNGVMVGFVVVIFVEVDVFYVVGFVVGGIDEG